MNDYTELDTEVLHVLRDGGRTFTALMSMGKISAIANQFSDKTKGGSIHDIVPEFRFLDRRLQALRKKGLIVFSAKSRKWELV